MRMIVAADPIIVARLRSRSQITLPDAVVRALGAREGDRFLVRVEAPDEVRLVRLRDSYAGALPGLWGETSEEIAAHLRELRDSWTRPDDIPG